MDERKVSKDLDALHTLSDVFISGFLWIAVATLIAWNAIVLLRENASFLLGRSPGPIPPLGLHVGECGTWCVTPSAARRQPRRLNQRVISSRLVLPRASAHRLVLSRRSALIPVARATGSSGGLR